MPSNEELGNGNSTCQQRATMHDNEESRSGSKTQNHEKKQRPIKNSKKRTNPTIIKQMKTLY